MWPWKQARDALAMPSTNVCVHQCQSVCETAVIVFYVVMDLTSSFRKSVPYFNLLLLRYWDSCSWFADKRYFLLCEFYEPWWSILSDFCGMHSHSLICWTFSSFRRGLALYFKWVLSEIIRVTTAKSEIYLESQKIAVENGFNLLGSGILLSRTGRWGPRNISATFPSLFYLFPYKNNR